LLFVLVFVLSTPFWLIGAISKVQLLPGLPVSAFAVICPGLAALILTHRTGGWSAVRALIRRLVDWKEIKPAWWLLLILFLIPAQSVLVFRVMQLLHLPLPNPQIEMLSIPFLLLIFLAAAVGEELGWSGYAIDALQKSYGALLGSLILGLVWAAWHIIPLLQAERTTEWIAWWCLNTLALRVIHTSLYNNTGKSVFGAVLFHASNNISWQLFPNQGSHFDPKISGLILAAIAVWIVAIWGPATLSRHHTPGAA
jgi:membrane protease YdiL (CAAX protease family)